LQGSQSVFTAETCLSHGTIERVIREYLKMKKVTSRRVPLELNYQQKVAERANSGDG